MEDSTQFDLEKKLQFWQDSVSSTQALTSSDVEELKSHLLDIYYELQTTGLSKEEAFLVAVNRIGSHTHWESEFERGNQFIFDLKRITLILKGVFFYFLTYYGIRMVAALILIVSIKLGAKPMLAITVTKYSILGLLTIIFLLFFINNHWAKSKLFSTLINKEFNTRYLSRIFICVVFCAIATRFTIPIIAKLIEQNRVRYFYYQFITYFDYGYSFVMLLLFIFVYRAFIKKAEVPLL